MGLNSNVFHTGFLTIFFLFDTSKTVIEEQAEEEGGGEGRGK
jgi:hypothetical protein